MFKEFWLYATTPCGSDFRKLGFLSESIAIEARYRRCKTSWRSHLQHSHQQVRAAIDGCRQHYTALVLGSGLLLDTPIEELAKNFSQVLLVDAVHPKSTRRCVQTLPNVTLIEHDITELLAKPASQWPSVRPSRFLQQGNISLVISANTLSQLPLFAINRARKEGHADDEVLVAMIVARHLEYLQSFPCPVCLITDLEWRFENRVGACIETYDALAKTPLPAIPMETWHWEVAPFGEIAPDMRQRNVVAGMWFEP